jgi:hypothetical protein
MSNDPGPEPEAAPGTPCASCGAALSPWDDACAACGTRRPDPPDEIPGLVAGVQSVENLRTAAWEPPAGSISPAAASGPAGWGQSLSPPPDASPPAAGAASSPAGPVGPGPPMAAPPPGGPPSGAAAYPAYPAYPGYPAYGYSAYPGYPGYGAGYPTYGAPAGYPGYPGYAAAAAPNPPTGQPAPYPQVAAYPAYGAYPSQPGYPPYAAYGYGYPAAYSWRQRTSIPVPSRFALGAAIVTFVGTLSPWTEQLHTENFGFPYSYTTGGSGVANVTGGLICLASVAAFVLCLLAGSAARRPAIAYANLLISALCIVGGVVTLIAGNPPSTTTSGIDGSSTTSTTFGFGIWLTIVGAAGILGASVWQLLDHRKSLSAAAIDPASPDATAGR